MQINFTHILFFGEKMLALMLIFSPWKSNLSWLQCCHSLHPSLYVDRDI